MAGSDNMDRLLSQALASGEGGVPAGDCPDEGLLAAWLGGGLEEAEARQVEKHLASCPLCRETLAMAMEAGDEQAPPVEWREQAARLMPGPAQVAEQTSPSSWQRVLGWLGAPFLAPAAGLALVLAVTVYVVTNQAHMHQVAMQDNAPAPKAEAQRPVAAPAAPQPTAQGVAKMELKEAAPPAPPPPPAPQAQAEARPEPAPAAKPAPRAKEKRLAFSAPQERPAAAPMASAPAAPSQDQAAEPQPQAAPRPMEESLAASGAATAPGVKADSHAPAAPAPLPMQAREAGGLMATAPAGTHERARAAAPARLARRAPSLGLAALAAGQGYDPAPARAEVERALEACARQGHAAPPGAELRLSLEPQGGVSPVTGDEAAPGLAACLGRELSGRLLQPRGGTVELTLTLASH